MSKLDGAPNHASQEHAPGGDFPPQRLQAAGWRTRVSGWRRIGFAALLFSLLQAACPAIIAVSGVRVAIGLGAFASAAGTDAPPRGLHQDLIRIPMMSLAALGALLNLFVLWQVRRLRARPAAQWRLAPVPANKLCSERFQIVLALVTFAILAAEWLTHPMIHHPAH